jgi:PPP family 3-phenylpropionic acid transporter
MSGYLLQRMSSLQWAMVLRFALLYGALYLSFGVQSPYFPILLQSRGLGPELIGIVLAANTAMRLVAGPTAGKLADGFDACRTVLTVCALLAAALSSAYVTVSSFWPMLVIATMQAATLAPLAPLSDTLVLPAAAPRSSGPGFTYGQVRGIGSAAFIFGTLLSGGLVSHSGINSMVFLSAFLLVSTGAAAASAPLLPSGTAAPLLPGARRGIATLMRASSYRRTILVAALILGSHAMHDSFAMIRWQATGITTAVAGLLWSEQVAAEVFVFLLIGPWLLDRLGMAHAAALAAMAGVLRWGVMGASAWLPAMVLIEPLHGISFALLHLACMRRLVQVVPLGLSATALTVYSTGIGLATTLVTIASGPLYAQWGARAFWVMAVLCASALPVALTLREDRVET